MEKVNENARNASRIMCIIDYTKQMIEYCGYTHGKLSVNGASSISGHVSLEI